MSTRFSFLLASLLAFVMPLSAQGRGSDPDAALERWAKAKDGDDRGRARALTRLGEVDDPRVTAILLDELARAQGPWLEIVIRAIGQRPRPQAVPSLRDILVADSTAFHVRRAAGTAMANSGNQGIDALLALLGDGDRKAGPMVRDACLTGLAASRDDRALRGLAVHAVQGTAPQRLDVLRRLAGVKDNEAVTKARLACAGETDELLAATAVRQLCEDHHPKADALAAALTDRGTLPPPVQAELVIGLASLGNPASYPLLLRLADSDAGPVRAALRPAAEAVAKDQQLVEWLAREGLGGTPAQRQAAARLLQTAPPDTIRPLLAKVREKLMRPTKQDLDVVLSLNTVLAKDPTWKDQVLALARANDAALRAAGLDLLRELKAQEGLELAQHSLDHKQWEVRVAAIRFLGEVRDLTSIPLLIARVEREGGRLETELGEVLFKLTARRFADRASWETWWRKNKDTHQLPEQATVTINEGNKPPSGQGQTVAYFDIRVVSKHVSFLVDVSGSMSTPCGTDRKHSRLDEAKSQLTKVVAAVPEECACNLIVYSTVAKGVWDRLRPAKPQYRQELQKAVDALRIGGSTNMYDALELAFHDPEVDTIYLLSDGQPSSGAIVEANALADEVRRWNRARQIVIHCISIGEESLLFKRLAAESGGQYRFVR